MNCRLLTPLEEKPGMERFKPVLKGFLPGLKEVIPVLGRLFPSSRCPSLGLWPPVSHILAKRG